ncbi:hypothetical protein Geu3261_0079_011 [Komagataeibacter europaeus NBRC 3261]|uniref:Uncharacterized protein n=1 Tax=Komagataeibacter europaeus NBRC 3261 TaxID=1234669 RepID=A0A0D6Q1A1_KOMEU|nr:hypothetical protein [Komagataeibacter europaeus]GAN96561.1 hypothetical protein Geu3261_0079_011 [Komagataeibacter europaeus NBRC 3261]
MAKPRPAVSLVPSVASSLGTPKAGAIPAIAQQKQEEKHVKEPSKGGRPRTLPDNVKNISVRVSDDVRRALRQASLNHDMPIQQIILTGIMDQLSRLGVVVEE